VVRHKRFKGNPPAYYRVSVVQSRATIDIAASGLERDPPMVCPECRQGGVVKRTRQLILEEGTWGGEDVFIARGLAGTYFTSERFRKFCAENQIKNAVLVPSEKYSFDFYR
jgi:hypothetical protein